MRVLAAAVVVAACLASCTRRPVLPEGMAVYVDIDAEYPAGEKIPELYRVFFYSQSTGKAVVSDFVPTQGGEMHLPAGSYRYFIYNFDLESTMLEDLETGNSVRAYTSVAQGVTATFREMVTNHDILAGAGGTKDGEADYGTGDPVRYSPDRLFVATGDVTVGHRSVEDEYIVIEAFADDVLPRLDLTVKGLRGLQYVSAVSAYITGMSDSMFPVTGKPSDSGAVFYVDCRYEADSSWFAGGCMTFGTLAREAYLEGGRRCVAYVVVTDLIGGQYVYAEDVTDQVLACLAAGVTVDVNLQLVFDFEVPPVKEDAGGGFSPSLDDWHEEEVPVPIG